VTDIIVVGASGFGRDIAQQARDAIGRHPELRFKGFLDDDPDKIDTGETSLGFRVLGNTETYVIREHDRFLIAVSEPAVRRRLADRLLQRGGAFVTLIHPTAYVAPTAVMDDGCFVAPFATVGSSARLGHQVLVNLYACAGHDTDIGSCSTLSPYAVANGGCVLGQGVFLGTQAAIMPNTKVGARSKVAAGAIVYRDVPVMSLATGNPARSFPIGHVDD
jgi:sugar O-acyltransferase (sialic acid O-acetyltransferase NeuD family)